VADFLSSVLSFVVRLSLLLAGLVFFAGLLVVASVLLLVWLLRALWARWTGAPVSPWTFQVHRHAMWRQFHPRPPNHTRRPSPGDVVEVDARDVTNTDTVTDVEPNSITQR